MISQTATKKDALWNYGHLKIIGLQFTIVNFVPRAKSGGLRVRDRVKRLTDMKNLLGRGAKTISPYGSLMLNTNKK